MHFVVELFNKSNIVYEKVVKSSNKENAVINVMRNKDYNDEFTSLKVTKVNISWVKIED